MLCNRKEACFLKLSQPTPSRLKCSVMTTVKEKIVPAPGFGLEKGEQVRSRRSKRNYRGPIEKSKDLFTLSFNSLTVYLLFFVCWPLKDGASYMFVVGYHCMHDGKAASPAILSTQSPHLWWNDIIATFAMDSCYNAKNNVFKQLFF